MLRRHAKKCRRCFLRHFYACFAPLPPAPPAQMRRYLLAPPTPLMPPPPRFSYAECHAPFFAAVFAILPLFLSADARFLRFVLINIDSPPPLRCLRHAAFIAEIILPISPPLPGCRHAFPRCFLLPIDAADISLRDIGVTAHATADFRLCLPPLFSLPLLRDFRLFAYAASFDSPARCARERQMTPPPIPIFDCRE